MLSTRGDRVPWRPLQNPSRPRSVCPHSSIQVSSQGSLPVGKLYNMHRVLYFVGKQLERVLLRWLFAWISFLFFLLLVHFPPNNAIISNGQWKIRAHTERRGSPPPQRSNTANVIYVMCTLYPPPNTIVKPPTSSISFPLTISIWIENWIFMSKMTRTQFPLYC